MNTNDNRQYAHDEIDHIFIDLLPTQRMAARPAQIALSHQMLDAMLEGGIALCDAGTGIGKTYAYLIAGMAFLRFRADCGMAAHPSLSPPPASPCKTPFSMIICPFFRKFF